MILSPFQKSNPAASGERIYLKSFFDEINHERLMSRLRKAISDERLINR